MISSTRRILLFTSVVIIVLFLLVGCKNNLVGETETINTEVSETEKTSYDSNTRTDNDEPTASIETREAKPTQRDAGGATPGLLKFRLIYYSVPRPFADIVGNEKADRWTDEYHEGNDGNQGNTNGMAMKAFIQYFNISREDFDKANLKWAKIVRDDFGGEPMMDPKDFANQETDEVFNGDIIYTFDDEIINEYYMGHPDEFYPYWYADEYEQAVKEGYVPRTTDWVDVGKMEADIIAKYGSTD